jgi:hypothetical protein
MNILRRTIAPTAILALTLLTGVAAPASHAAVSVNGAVSFDFFYSDLAPHGSWLVSAQYGRVWQPAVYAPGWNPYYDGHWVYTDCGWTWVSDYDWGDVPYHYGTWYDDASLGWIWVPGTTWAPAWVTFRTGPDFIGWAPVAPGFSIGVSFGAPAPVSSFLFVSTRDFAAPRIRQYVVPADRRDTIIQRTTIVNNLTVQNNVVVNRGPEVRTIEQASGRTFRPEPIERVAHVAPFQGVRRDQLAIASAQRGQHVQAAEPVSAQRPVPQGGERASLQNASPSRQRELRQQPQPQPQVQQNERRPERPNMTPNQAPQVESQRPKTTPRETPQAAPPARPERHASPPPATETRHAQPQAQPQPQSQQKPQRQTPNQAPKKKSQDKKPPNADEKGHEGGGGH